MIPASTSRLIYSYWLLDNAVCVTPRKQQYKLEESCYHLTDTAVDVDLISKVMKTFYDLGGYSQALQFAKARKSSFQGLMQSTTYLNILMQNGLIHEAFTFQRLLRISGFDPSHLETLLYHFFKHCLHGQNMGVLFQLPLDLIEEQSMVHFLKLNAKQHVKDFLSVYYLQRNRFTTPTEKTEISHGNNTTIRNALLANYKRSLPAVQQFTVDYVDQKSALFQPPVNSQYVPESKRSPSHFLKYETVKRDVPRLFSANNSIDNMVVDLDEIQPNMLEFKPIIRTNATPLNSNASTPKRTSTHRRVSFSSLMDKERNTLAANDQIEYSVSMLTPDMHQRKSARLSKRGVSGAEPITLSGNETMDQSFHSPGPATTIKTSTSSAKKFGTELQRTHAMKLRARQLNRK